MTVPSSYTPEELATYMHAVLGKTARVLGWTVQGSYDEAVNDAAILCGVSDVAAVSDIEKLRAAARLAVWRAVEADTAANFRFATDQQSFDRQQVHGHAVAMVKRARVEAMRHGVELAVTATPIRHIDPYTVVPDSERRR